jgi:hypothetical protein
LKRLRGLSLVEVVEGVEEVEEKLRGIHRCDYNGVFVIH